MTAPLAAQQSSSQALELLLAKSGIAQAVPTAPAVHRGCTPLSLAHLFSALPAELHNLAVRGNFAVSGSPGMLAQPAQQAHACMRVAQLLMQQHHVTSVAVH